MSPEELVVAFTVPLHDSDSISQSPDELDLMSVSLHRAVLIFISPLLLVERLSIWHVILSIVISPLLEVFIFRLLQVMFVASISPLLDVLRVTSL